MSDGRGGSADPTKQSLSARLYALVPSKPTSGSIIRTLTATQNCSALVFSIFLGVHLVSPIAATLGGASLADKSLLIGRAYYLPSELVTIYLPLAIHLTCSTLKRSILIFKTRKAPPLTPHLVTGWLMPLFLIPHVFSHRLIPASSSPPISNLSPGELGYEFVGWAVDRSPVRGYVSYLGLIGLGVWHSGVGMMKVVSWIKRTRAGSAATAAAETAPDGAYSTTIDPPAEVESSDKVQLRQGQQPVDVDVVAVPDEATETPRRIVSKKRKLGLRSVLVVFLGFIAVGLARVARESRGTSRVMATRYEAVYARLWRGL